MHGSQKRFPRRSGETKNVSVGRGRNLRGVMVEKIDIKTQPASSSVCGQYCVAMVAGVSKKEAIKAVGTISATRMTQLIKGLQRLGVNCSDHSKRIKGGNKPEVAIILIKDTYFKNSGWSHYVVWFKGMYYDPNGETYSVTLGSDPISSRTEGIRCRPRYSAIPAIVRVRQAG